MEQADDGALEFGTAAGVDGGGREGLPYDRFADVGGDEERNSRAETVPFLEEFIEKDDDKSGSDELDDEEETDAGADVARLAVETGEYVDGCLAERDDHGEDWMMKSAYQSFAEEIRKRQKLPWHISEVMRYAEVCGR